MQFDFTDDIISAMTEAIKQRKSASPNIKYFYDEFDVDGMK